MRFPKQAFCIVIFICALSLPVSGQKKGITPLSLDKITPEVLKLSSLGNIELGAPGGVTFYDDSHILITDRRAKAAISLVDINTGKVVDSLLRGRGPGESLSPWTVTVSDDIIYIDDSQRGGKLLVLRPKGGKLLALDHEIKINGNYLRIIPNPSGGFISLPYTEARFEILDANGISCGYGGSFPRIKGDNSLVSNTSAQSMIAMSPDGKHLCSSYLMMNYLEIYSNSLKSLIRLWGPDKIVPQVKTSDVTSFLEPKTKVYSSISASNGGFAVGYIGKLEERDFAKAGTKYLLIFDWEGHCLKVFELPVEISYFDINWRTNRLIVITKEADPSVMTAVIKGLPND